MDLRLRDRSGFELYTWFAARRPELAAHVAFVSGGGTELAGRVEVTGRPVLQDRRRRGTP